MKSFNQKGFTAIMILLIVILLAILGGTGYYVWNAQQQANKNLSSASNEKFATPSKKPAKKTKKPAPAQQYMTITEWGVKIPLTTAISDAYYHINSQNPDYAYVSVKSVSNVTGCALSDDVTTGSGVIFRFKSDTVDPQTEADPQPKTYLSENPNAVKIGDYYYSYEKDNQATCSDQQAVQDKVSAASPDFASGVAKIQAE